MKIALLSLLFTIIILSTLYSGCICQLEPPPYAYSFRISVVDKNTGRSLIQLRDSVYSPDSVFIQKANSTTAFKLYVNRNDTVLYSEYISPGSDVSDTLYFRWKNTVADTIIIFTHDEKKNKCGEQFRIVIVDRILFNGSLICDGCNFYNKEIRVKK